MNQLTTFLAALPLLISIFEHGEACGSVKRHRIEVKNFAVQQESRMIKGTWGGNHISLEVSEEGAYVEFDCAHGTVSEALRVNSQGKFRASGTYVRETAGPQPVDGEDKSLPVIYSGTTDNKTATFTITNPVTDEVIGTFAVIRGKRSRLTKCQ
jgi:hypothetical protein